jgi:hypothetical protein
MANRSQRVIAEYERNNLEAAVVILNDPVQFPPGCGSEMWARLFMERRTREAGHRDQGSEPKLLDFKVLAEVGHGSGGGDEMVNGRPIASPSFSERNA